MRKTEWHFWTLDQYNEEEQWLNKKAEEGWALVDAFAVRYVFESCEPGEYVYKILFTDGIRGTEERDNFISFMNENGIEEVGRYHRWGYYRKKNDGTPFEMFNTKSEELAHVNKIKNLASALVAVMAMCLFIEIMAVLHNRFMLPALIMVAAVSIMIFKVYKGLDNKAKELEKDINLYE